MDGSFFEETKNNVLDGCLSFFHRHTHIHKKKKEKKHPI